MPRAGKRVPWPALVQTRAIAPGEPLRWVYNSNPTTPMGRQIRQWRRQEEELQELCVLRPRLLAGSAAPI